MIKINLIPEDFDVKGIIRGNLSVLRSRKLRERLENLPIVEDSIVDCNGMTVRALDIYCDCEGRMFLEKPNNGERVYLTELFFRYNNRIFPEISNINVGADIPSTAFQTINQTVRAYHPISNSKISHKPYKNGKKRGEYPQKPERVLTLQA